MRARRPVADDDAGEVDREEAGAVGDLRHAEDDERGRRHERRVQPLRQRHLVEADHHQAAADDAEQRAEHGLANQFDHEMRERAVADRDQLDQHQGQEHRERIVAAGLRLQRGADARPQPQALGMHQQEHGRGIGRGDDGADQHGFGPAEVERIFRDRRGDERGHQHPHGGERHRGRQHGAVALEARAQAAIEQDQRQRDRADQIGGTDVLEFDMTGAGITREHADDEEHQQQRRAEAQGQQARQDAGHDQDRAKEDGNADGVE